MPWLKFNQNVHVAVGAKIITQNGPEQSKPFDVMTLAEIGDFLFIDLDF